MITGIFTQPKSLLRSFNSIVVIVCIGSVLNGRAARAETGETQQLKVLISLGHLATEKSLIRPQFISGSPGLEVIFAKQDEMLVGGGPVAKLLAEVSWNKPTEPPRDIQSIWKYLLEHGEPGQVARLTDDSGLQPAAPVLTVQLSDDGTQGFSIGLDQLTRHQAMWLPEQHAFITLADAPVDFEQHLESLQGIRVLDQVKIAPEATYAEWSSMWVDFGDPIAWQKPWETSWMGTRGHLTEFVARHGSLYKFALDRWSGVRPDMASPHKFRLDPLWPGATWSGQQIVDGLPILVTSLDRDSQHCEIEQFAAALSEEAPAARGEVASVLMTKMTFSGSSGKLDFGFRLASENKDFHPEVQEVAGRTCIVDRETGNIWLMFDLDPNISISSKAVVGDENNPRIEVTCAGERLTDEPLLVVAKFSSPPLSRSKALQLASLDTSAARSATQEYWEDWLSQGAGFQVPEKVVNDLFRANLWHALGLPRHRTDELGVARIDLPYSNLAYGQTNADWPINQAVYVDYMLHGLRGYYAVAEEEFAAIYHTQQKANGRVGGFAEWGVYSPSMLYSIGKNFLLSGDRESFERLLPQSMRALDWCLSEIAKGMQNSELPGVIVAPLNDLTHESRAWAFPNAYFVAGLEVFGLALAEYGHPRAGEVTAVADQMRADVSRAFARASVKSPVVQLADGTWINFVPGDAMTPRRMLDEWYPTDVDCGPLHLSRLAAIDPRGWMTTAMLHDHEDNLFLNQWGMANEPIYNQQATAYLYRDEPEAAIRAFYSMLACAFSHHQLTPLEHRWAWGQYYMPPSTDGAWFELYRNMLINELVGNGTLLIGQAIPRAWLKAGKVIKLTDVPTYYGPVNLDIESDVDRGAIRAKIEFLSERRPETLRVRLRHPDMRRIKSVMVNGVPWKDVDAERECVNIPEPKAKRVIIRAGY